MPDEHKGEIEHVTAEWVYQEWIGEEELCARLSIGPELLDLCQQWDIIQPSHTTSEGKLMFSHHTLDRLVSGLRLHRDLGVNWEGIGIVLDLLDRIQELESKLKESFPLG